MTLRSQIFMLSTSDWRPGLCAVCNQAALIKYRDSSGMNLGECCLAHAISAERALICTEGIRHPTKEEAAAHGSR